MQVYELAKVEKKDSHYVVLGVIKSTLEELGSNGEDYLKLSYNSYNIIKTALGDNQIVFISKELSTDEVLPSDIEVRKSKKEELDVIKTIKINKIKNKLDYNMLKLPALDILNFTLINNELIQSGFVITNDTREDKYIEIIETEDEVLIGKLEKYLVILDTLEDINLFVNTSNKSIDIIQKAKSIDSIEKEMKVFYKLVDLSFE